MAGLTIEVINMEQVMESLVQLGAEVVDAAQEASIHEAEHELEITQVYVPRNTGALAATGRVEVGENEAGEVTAAIAYGDEEVDYALAVHEDLEANHPEPTKAKYVEDVVNEELSSGKGVERMMNDMQKRMGWS